jgi:S-DNA-T family DNA segregation ATPase FtsK/SpoIIIE
MDGTRMQRSLQRRAAIGFCLNAVALVACLFAWICILTFDAADPPAHVAWPQPEQAGNACGVVGAWIAYHLFHYVGVGVYPLMLLLTAAIVARLRKADLPDPWLRLLGSLLIVGCCSAFAAMFMAPADTWLLTGPGGVLGASAATFLVSQLQTTGTVVVLSCALLVGLILAADEWVLAACRGLGWAAPRSARVIARGSVVIGGVAANGYGRLSSRLATAGASPGGGDSPPAPPALAGPRQRAALQMPAEELGSHDAVVVIPRPKVDSSQSRAAADPPADAGASTGNAPNAAGGNRAAIADNAGDQSTTATPSAASATRVADDKPKEGEAGPVVTQLGPIVPHARRMPPSPKPIDDDYTLPDEEMLDEPSPLDKKAIEIRCREKAYILEQTLNEFRLDVRVVAIETGPVITVFELKLSPGIKVSQIVSLSNDIARALKAPAVRVVAPLPGKNTIGIEVPNLDKEKVRLKDLMRMIGSNLDRLGIPLFLGKDASGQPVVADLTRMPHMLIAGTTGSGKSVCVSSIVMSILLSRTPKEVNLILIDPKVVELSTFKDIPHLISPIVTEVGKAEGILDWAATKMDERYALLAEAGVKDIGGYNRLGVEKLRDRFQPADDDEMQHIPTFLPYIVIIIDELADLMMTSAKEVEFYLCRLAQKSRAVGIHLIVSTQRPQANVVTGLIKSNLPCRIAFRVSSRLDSRIVLDQNGGEVLLGQGDMLFLPPGTSKLVRAQGAFVSDEELRSVVKHCSSQAEPQFNPELVRLPTSKDAGPSERDELFDMAVDAVVESGRGSVSLLQRKLTVGYGRASRLIDQMYDAGLVGEYKGSQAREVTVTKDEWEQIKTARDREEMGELFAEG